MLTKVVTVITGLPLLKIHVGRWHGDVFGNGMSEGKDGLVTSFATAIVGKECGVGTHPRIVNVVSQVRG